MAPPWSGPGLRRWWNTSVISMDWMARKPILQRLLVNNSKSWLFNFGLDRLTWQKHSMRRWRIVEICCKFCPDRNDAAELLCALNRLGHGMPRILTSLKSSIVRNVQVRYPKLFAWTQREIVLFSLKQLFSRNVVRNNFESLSIL